jgi:hypothetical protein
VGRPIRTGLYECLPGLRAGEIRRDAGFYGRDARATQCEDGRPFHISDFFPFPPFAPVKLFLKNGKRNFIFIRN